jgi:hypothetical protein
MGLRAVAVGALFFAAACSPPTPVADSDGTWVGTITTEGNVEVQVPSDLLPFETYLVVQERLVVGVTLDEAGVLRVKRFRLVLPEEE